MKDWLNIEFRNNSNNLLSFIKNLLLFKFFNFIRKFTNFPRIIGEKNTTKADKKNIEEIGRPNKLTPLKINKDSIENKNKVIDTYNHFIIRYIPINLS